MKNFTLKKVVFFLTGFLLFITAAVKAQTLTRGPYLQAGKQDSITIRWRTNIASNSRVTWGTSYVVSPGTYANTYTQDVAVPVTEHIVRIGGLLPDTKYWYTIGTTTLVLQQTSTNYFLTLPPENTTRKMRFVAIGDCGNNSTNQVNVKNTFINYIGANDIDGMILLGDNAYTSGTDGEYQTSFFDIYRNDLLKYNKLYPAPGNHDYGNNSANTGRTGGAGGSMPYHNNFTVPMGGEIGGVPSGAKNYYSFNIGGVHFISLDSYGRDDANTTKMYDTTGAQATWLKADLAANTQKWTVAYFHHPPYTKTSHNSDFGVGSPELDLVAVRERFIRILERNGVDLILCGHSHGYERSFLLKNYYNTYAAPLDDDDFNILTHTALGNRRNAKYNGGNDSTKAYTYNSGKYNHGSIYAVAGSAGQVGGTATGYPLDCMYYSNSSNGGCLYFEVEDNRLDAKFISYTTAPTPIIRDQFTIFKDVKKKTNQAVVTGDVMTLTATWPGTYVWTENGVVITGENSRSYITTPGAPGVYQYIVSDSYGDLRDTFNITVANSPLPVLLNSFSATLDNNTVLLNWSTNAEQDNKFFTIERSDDGNNFQILKNIDGAGNSSTVKNYHTVDNAPLQGTSYYRLSQTNNNGSKTYFDTKKINYNPGRSFSYSVNNTAAGSVNVVISTLKSDNIGLSVADMLGREVWHKNIAAAPGTNTIQELKLQKGAYVLTVSNTAGERISNKIIVN